MLSHGVFIEDPRVRGAVVLTMRPSWHQHASHLQLLRKPCMAGARELSESVCWVGMQPSPLEPVVAAVVRFAAPLVFAYYLIQFSFRLGIKRKSDKCADLDRVPGCGCPT